MIWTKERAVRYWANVSIRNLIRAREARNLLCTHQVTAPRPAGSGVLF
jgi:hypothetical protein